MSSKPLAWITGAGGLIGNNLVQTAPQFAPAWSVKGLTREQLDLLDFASVRRAFSDQPPMLIIHCAALSRSPDCQANPPLARRINVEATAVLAELAKDIPFLFLSSDLVFDGRKGNYLETDSVGPLSIYAETKVAAEQIVLANPRHTVVRTSLNGGMSPTGDRGFNEQIRLAWQAGQTLRLFTDEFRCPIPAVATAQAIWELVSQSATGLFHLAGAARLSRWQIAQLIAERWPQLNPELQATSRKEYQGAPRPADTSLNCGKVQSLLSFPLPGLTAWLAAHPDEPF
ncbi:MAG: NAD(P)-dependent oxidoreductase [Verrucomicrobia bacterium]|nr:NAD(P)-dependent oxidoreductase [Verrucomicrobiota bacterium]